jgi:hypothetical protein
MTTATAAAAAGDLVLFLFDVASLLLPDRM